MVKFGVVVFPGSNCDRDCYDAIERVIGESVIWIWYQEQDLHGCDVVILPGGFSYGDYLRPGAIARFSPVMKALEGFVSGGGLLLGICNGFQILLEAGFLPGSMRRNNSLKFICKDVYLRVDNIDTPFTLQYLDNQVIRLPIAHADGNYYADPETLNSLEKNGQIVFRYSDKDGRITEDSNPNGSMAGIAGICNDQGNVLGMMPHPERAVDALLGGQDGRILFESMVRFLGIKMVSRL
jgi:phosphoribosylformylglycinamidine synthase